MAEINPIAEGAKSLAESLEQTRQAGKKLSKTIQNIQHDGVEVAQEQLQAKEKLRLHQEAVENSMLFKAIKEYEKQSVILKEEKKAEKNFKTQYGVKSGIKFLN